MNKNALKTAVLLTILQAAATSVYANDLMKVELEPVVVEAERETIADGRFATTQEVGLLGDKTIMETPLHQVTLTSKVIDEFSRPGRGMLDALTLDPSIRTTNGSMDTSVYIRGFSGSGKAWNLNGVPNMTHQKQMPYNFAEKVSFISGPSIGVAGNATPFNAQTGGSINMISKKAGDTRNASVELGWASDSYLIQKIDIGDRFGKNKEWGLRLNTMNAVGDLRQDGANDKQRNVYLNIDRRGKHSKTNLLAGYDYDNNTGLGSTINLNTKTIKSLPKVPKNTSALAPTWNNDKYKNTVVVLNHEQKFGGENNLSYFINAGYHKEDYTSWLQQWSSRTLNDMAGNYTGTYTQMPVYHTNTYVGAGFKGSFDAGGWKNDWVVNVERSEFKRDRDNHVSDANKYPVIGNIYTGSFTSKPNVVWDPITHQYTTVMWGWSALDTITTPDKKVELTLGMHGHRVETTNYDNGSSSGLRRTSDATSPVAAVVYKASPNLSFYADHTETFSEGSAVGSNYNNDGEMLPPTKTKQNEIGMKVQSGGLLHTLSLFDITQENAIDVPVTLGPKYQVRVLDGEERHRGIEYSVVGSLNKKWDAIFGLSYMHAYQNKTQGGANDGRTISGVPRLSGDLALIYKPDDAWKLIGRVNYTGTTSIRETSSYEAPIDIPSATILDLGASYKTKIGKNPVTISAMCYNVFDRDYWYGAGTNSIGLGAPRTFMVSAKFDF